MKYKNINSAIHNFGHSFLSMNNHVNDRFIINDLADIHAKGFEITIDWLAMLFEPKSEMTDRIELSLGFYTAAMSKHFSALNVNLDRLTSLNFVWPVDSPKFMEATDDRGKHYKICVMESD